MTRFAALLRWGPLGLAALAGCQTPASTVPEAPAPVVAVAAPPVAAPPSTAVPRPPTLPEEQRRLAALFHGTPVVVAMQADGALRVDVPLRFCFERGGATPKPALVAVLDRMAQSQHDTATRLQISAAGEAPPKPRAAASAPARPTAAATARAALPFRRAQSVRDRLASQGIAAERMTVVDGDAAGVRLLVSEPPAP